MAIKVKKETSSRLTKKIDCVPSYLGSMMGLHNLSLPTEESASELRPFCSPFNQRTISPITKRMSRPFSSLLDSRRVTPSKTTPSLSINEPQTCNVCHEKLSGKTVRLPDSLNKYHWGCLKCKSCDAPFEDASFYVDQTTKYVYHRSVSIVINFL